MDKPGVGGGGDKKMEAAVKEAAGLRATVQDLEEKVRAN